MISSDDARTYSSALAHSQVTMQYGRAPDRSSFLLELFQAQKKPTRFGPMGIYCKASIRNNNTDSNIYTNNTCNTYHINLFEYYCANDNYNMDVVNNTYIDNDNNTINNKNANDTNCFTAHIRFECARQQTVRFARSM